MRMFGERRGMAAAVVFLAGCVGLGDSSSETVDAKRPPARAVAQARNDIPLVPLPLPATKAPSRAAAPAEPPPAPDASRWTVSSPPPAPANASPSAPPHTAQQLLQEAKARCANLNSYIVRLTRREQHKGKGNPEEIIAFSFRKNPFSVHFKWLGETAKGREVVYVKGRFNDKIHTKVAAGDAPLVPAGARLSLSPENPLVRSASRHPITDAGIDHCVESLSALFDAQERGDRRHGTLTVLPPQQRPEYPQPVETLERLIPPGIESELPNGGRRLMYFDPDWKLPLLVVTYDDKGNEVEYYRYDRLMTPANLDDDDFNPDKLWAATKKAGNRE
jgi:hypothetical protein